VSTRDDEALERVLAKFVQHNLEQRRSETTDQLDRVARAFGMTTSEVKRVVKPVVQNFLDDILNV